MADTVDAASGESWTTPVPLSPESGIWAGASRLVVDPAGNLTVAYIGTTPNFFEPSGLVVRRQAAGTNTWTSPELLDPQAIALMSLAVDNSGTVTLVYAHRRHPYFTQSSAGGAFATPAPIAPGFPGAIWRDDPGLAVTADGTINAVWLQHDRLFDGRRETRAVWSQLPAGTTTWTSPRHLSPRGSRLDAFKMSAGPDGSLLVAWDDLRGRPCRSRLLPAGSAKWSPATAIAPGTHWLDDVVNLGGGAATVMVDTDTNRTRVLVAQRRSDGSWRRLRPLISDQSRYQEGWDLAASGHRTVALWNNGSMVEVSMRSHGQWGPPHAVSPRLHVTAFGVSLQTYPDGVIRAAWLFSPARPSAPNPGPLTLRTAIRGPDATWGPTATIPDTRGVYEPDIVPLTGHGADAVFIQGGLDNDSNEVVFTQTMTGSV